VQAIVVHSVIHRVNLERLAASQLLEHQAFKELLDSPFSSDEEMKLD
jgi:hypothetical protein